MKVISILKEFWSACIDRTKKLCSLNLSEVNAHTLDFKNYSIAVMKKLLIGGAMDSHALFEEELMTKMHFSFVQRFDLDQLKAAELTLEIMEILSLYGSDFNDINSQFNGYSQVG